MLVAVIDGQGGGVGKSIVERLRALLGSKVDIIALGTNALATSLMIKSGANEGASGENAIIVNAPRADFIIGGVAVIAADSMLGELTPLMANAIAKSSAKKVLIPLNRCGLYIAGVKDVPLLQHIDDAIELIKTMSGIK